MTKILLLDSNSLLNRAFYALPPMNTKKGVPTNAVYGYMSMLIRLLDDEKPTHVAAVFDVHAPTFRHEMYSAYKAQRKPMPEDLRLQMPLMHRLLEAMNVKIIEKAGYEADDVIGTLAKRFSLPTIIVSGDRDVLQLVDDTTRVYHTRRGVTDVKVYTAESMAEEGFKPESVIEMKALQGDASDNIPGCPGVGEKTAAELVSKYGSIENVYASIDEIKGKLREKLEQNRELVEMSKTLATIATDAPVECTLSDIEFKPDYGDRFKSVMGELEFVKLLSRFDPNAPKTSRPVRLKPESVSEPVTEELPFAVESKSFEIVETDDLESLKGILKSVKDKFFIETAPDGFRFSTGDGKEYKAVVSQTLLGGGIDYDGAVEAFREVLESDVKKVFFDLKEKMSVFAAAGINFGGNCEDLLLKSYLINSDDAYKSYSVLADAMGYAEGSAAAAFEIDAALDEKLNEKNLTKLYRDVELKLVKVLFGMERTGFRVDIEVLKELGERFNAELKELTDKIYEEAGERFNINSAQQLGVILFDKLGLKHGKKTKGKTGYSVAAEILEELDHPVVTLVLRYRKIKKLHSTYIEGIRPLIAKDGRVHTVFKQCLTTTGRLSSTEPNLQNIPIRTAEGREIRKMFVPARGNVLVSADYSQIELRLLAHFSGDPVLTEAYREGADIHALTASKFTGVPVELVTKEMRRSAKAVNFGIIYGISAFGLANNIGCHPKEAQRFVDKYFETYPYVKSYMESNVEFAKEHGYVKTLLGRIRYFPELKSPNRNIRAFGERAAMNMPLQGSAADIMKLAMLRTDEELKKGGFKAKTILQVHDELVIDCPEEEKEAVKKLLTECMENVVKLNVPLVAEAKSGTDWYSVE